MKASFLFFVVALLAGFPLVAQESTPPTPPAAAEETQPLQGKSATSDKNITKSLQEIYSELIRAAYLRGDKEAALAYQIKLLELSPNTENREALLDCYRQLIIFRQEKHEQGLGSYTDILHTEIAYLKASIPGQTPEQREKTERKIRRKQEIIEEMNKAGDPIDPPQS